MKTFVGIMLATTFLLLVGPSFVRQKIESKIGPIDLSADTLTESRITAVYGQGYIMVEKPEKQYAYFLPEENIWLQLRYSHVLDGKLERTLRAILITRHKLCPKRFQPLSSLGKMMTSGGVQIGSSFGMVVKTYGKPTITIDVERDNTFAYLRETLKLKRGTVIRYLPSSSNGGDFFTEFAFDGKTLHSILISGVE